MKPHLLLLPSITAFTPTLSPATSKRSRRLQMFTGIVEEMGQVISLETKDDIQLWNGSTGAGTEMVVRGDVVLDGAYLG